MANIQTRQLSDGRTAYLVRWKDPTGRDKAAQFPKLKLAKPNKWCPVVRVEVGPDEPCPTPSTPEPEPAPDAGVAP